MAPWHSTPGARELIVRDTWLSFHQSFHVAEPAYWVSVHAGVPALPHEADLAGQFRAQGWLALEHGTAAWLPSGLESLFRDLANFQLPLPFAFVFDELWILSRRLLPVSRQLLGGACVALPCQWLWPADAPPRAGRHDLRPEVTGRAAPRAGVPQSVTWRLALSPATARATTIRLRPVAGSGEAGSSRPRARAAALLPALELRGELLAWDEGRWHWDGRSLQDSQDGLACLEVEHQRRDAEPLAQPQVNPEIQPSWEQRVRLIAQALQQYGAREPAARRLAEAGIQLIDALERPGTSGVA